MKPMWNQLARACVAIVLAVGGADHASAQGRPDTAPGATFIAQFPEGDVLKVQLVGDAFAEGLTNAVADVLQSEARFQVNRKHRQIGGLVRPEWEDDIKVEEASRETASIVILMTGLYDKQTIRLPNGSRSLPIGSDDWKEEYGRRFERLLKAVKKRGTAVYVIGQPILRSTTQNTHAELLTDLMRQRAQANGAKFIDIYETFQDEGSGYSQFGPDFTGNRVKLRESDGTLFTTLGNRKLALVLERELKRDLAQAASDRAIPLAGDEIEQKRISPARAAPDAAAGRVAGPGGRGVQSAVPLAPQGDATGDQKADNGRVTLRLVNTGGREEAVTIDIVRPAIPAAVIALLTRRESAGERSQQPGEGVVEDVGSGLTVVNSVSTLGEVSGQAGAKRVTPATQTAFYQVLIKGERMQPKPGRADDFTWPRVDVFVAPAVPSQPTVTRPQPAASRSTPAPGQSQKAPQRSN